MLHKDGRLSRDAYDEAVPMASNGGGVPCWGLATGLKGGPGMLAGGLGRSFSSAESCKICVSSTLPPPDSPGGGTPASLSTRSTSPSSPSSRSSPSSPSSPSSSPSSCSVPSSSSSSSTASPGEASSSFEVPGSAAAGAAGAGVAAEPSLGSCQIASHKASLFRLVKLDQFSSRVVCCAFNTSSSSGSIS